MRFASRPVSRVLSGGLPLRDGHSSGTRVAARLVQPTRVASLETGLARLELALVRPATPIWFCSRWGLPCRSCCQSRGALLPHPFTLARQLRRAAVGGLLSVALSLGSPPAAVSRHRVSMEPGLSSAGPVRHNARSPAAAVRPAGRVNKGWLEGTVKPSRWPAC